MPAFNYKNYRPTGITEVDSVVACIFWNRKNLFPIMSIDLRPNHYLIFMEFMRRLVPEEEFTGSVTFDGVDINKGSILQKKNISCNYYTPEPAEA